MADRVRPTAADGGDRRSCHRKSRKAPVGIAHLSLTCRLRLVRCARRVALRAAACPRESFPLSAFRGGNEPLGRGLRPRDEIRRDFSWKLRAFTRSGMLDTSLTMLPRLCAIAQVMPAHRLVSASNCFRQPWSNDSNWRGGVFGVSQKEEIQPSSSIRCRAGKEGARLNNKVPPVICGSCGRLLIRASRRRQRFQDQTGPKCLAKGAWAQRSIRALLSALYTYNPDLRIECQ